jgi:hypothetical protein
MAVAWRVEDQNKLVCVSVAVSVIVAVLPVSAVCWVVHAPVLWMRATVACSNCAVAKGGGWEVGNNVAMNSNAH